MVTVYTRYCQFLFDYINCCNIRDLLIMLFVASKLSAATKAKWVLWDFEKGLEQIDSINDNV